MTSMDAGHALGRVPAHLPAPYEQTEPAEETDENVLRALLDSSPARATRTSAAAELGFLAGLVALLGAPFSLLLAVCLGLGVLGVPTSILGLARASRPTVTGGLLASLGLVCSLLALGLIGLRLIGVDTAFGDSLGPVLVDWLTALNDQVPVSLRS